MNRIARDIQFELDIFSETYRDIQNRGGAVEV